MGDMPYALTKRLAQRMQALMDNTPAVNTQVKLAQAATVSQASVQRIMSGAQSPTLNRFEDIARAFKGIKPAHILLDDDEAELLRLWASLTGDQRQSVLGYLRVLNDRSAHLEIGSARSLTAPERQKALSAAQAPPTTLRENHAHATEHQGATKPKPKLSRRVAR